MPAVNSKVLPFKREPLFKSSRIQSSNANGDSCSRYPFSRSSLYDKFYTFPQRRYSNRITKKSQRPHSNEIDRCTNLEHKEQYRRLIEQFCNKTLAETEKLLSSNMHKGGKENTTSDKTILISDTPVCVTPRKVQNRIDHPYLDKTYLSNPNRTTSFSNICSTPNVLSSLSNKNKMEANEKTSLQCDSSLTSSTSTIVNKPLTVTSTTSSYYSTITNWFSPPSPYLCNTFIHDLVNSYGRRGRERKKKILEEETRSRLLKEKQDAKARMLSEMLEERLRVKSEPEIIILNLSKDMEDLIDNALVPHPQQQILCERFNIAITRQHIATLAGLNWLNDEIINFYMELIVERSKANDQLPSVHAMNTFFYPKLNSQGYKSVRRWTKRVDIFSKDLVFYPIHLGVHWTLAVVDFRLKKILYFDSMGGSNPRCLEALKDYLSNEFEDKKKEKFDLSGWDLISKNEEEIPQQLNGSDCGVFTCTFAEFLSRKAALSFTQSHMPLLRRTMVWEIINASLTR